MIPPGQKLCFSLHMALLEWRNGHGTHAAYRAHSISVRGLPSPRGLCITTFCTLHSYLSACPLLPVRECLCFTAPLEEDVDSEPAETEGEAAEDGDPGDTGAELDGMGPSLPSALL